MPGLEWQGASQPGLVSEDTLGRPLENAVSARTVMPDVTGSFAKPEEESSFEKELDSSKGDDKSAVSSNGVSERSESATPHRRKICILSIDGGGMRGIIPGCDLAYLEEALQKKSKNRAARIADYFDIAAGTSVGGILATMLFTADKNGKPLFTGEQLWRLIAEKGKQIFKIPKRQQAWAKLRGIVTPRYSTKYLIGLLKQYLVSGLPAKALKEMDDGRKSNVKKLVKLGDEMLASPCMEHLPYGGQVKLGWVHI
ncbi:unnamed protein product [Sphagnum troendelagicum]